jgi:hypothetical protein
MAEQKLTKDAGLKEYIYKALFNDRLIFIAITSAAEGKVVGEGFLYGEGKSTLALEIMKMILVEMIGLTDEDAEAYIKLNMGYDLEDDKSLLKRGRVNRVHCYTADDMEISKGKHLSLDPGIRAVASLFKAARPYCGVFIGTFPDLSEIAKAWRDLFMFEIKCPERGYYEVQMIKRLSDFRDPLNPYQRLDYKGESPWRITISHDLERWYKEWRDTRFCQLTDEIWDKYIYKKKEKPEPPKVYEEESSIAGQNLVKARERKKWEKLNQQFAPIPIV